MQKLKLSFLIVALILVTNISNSQWFPQNSGTNLTLNDIFFINTSTGFAVGDSAIIIKTTNGGANWFTVLQPSQAELFTIKFINSSTGWAGGGKPTGILNAVRTKAYYTTDGGNTWLSPFPMGYLISSWRFLNVKIIDLDKVFFTAGQCIDNVCDGSIVKTTNRGLNWTSVTNISGYYTGFSWINNQTGWAATNFWNDVFPYSVGKVTKTTNGGQNWIAIHSDTAATSPFYLSFADIQFFDVNTGYLLKDFSQSTQICISNNGGNNWSVIESAAQRYYDFFFLNKDTGWISGNQGVIKRTNNGGQNWNQQVTNVSGIIRKIFLVDAFFGWALSGSTILHTTNGGIMEVKVISTNTPDEFRLLQNFPNPFNPTTTIRYDIKAKGNVELKIFDLLGREITTLVNENQTPGTYEVVFDASSLPSGVYFYKLHAGDFVETRKMMLLK